MQTFTNQFNIAISNSKTEIVLKFSQLSPVMDSENNITGTESAPVADLVMTAETAKNLVRVLGGLLQDTEDISDET